MAPKKKKQPIKKEFPKAPEQKPASRKKREKTSRIFSPLVLSLIIFVFAFLIFSNTLENDFVWDDRDLIVDNPTVKTLDSATMKTIFFENFWEHTQRISGYYRPVVSLSYNINYALWGMNPRGFHMMNVIVNALVCVALFILIYLLFGNVILAAFTAVLFAALPLHVENVAWISGRTDIMATFWMVVSLIFYVLARQRAGVLYLAASLVAFALALLAKEIAVVLPLIVLFFDRWLMVKKGDEARGGRRGGSSLLEKAFPLITALYFAFVVVYFSIRKSVLGSSLSSYTTHVEGAVDTILLSFSILAGYVFKLIYPFRLNAEYDAPLPGDELFNIHLIAGVLFFASMIFALVRLRRRPVYVTGIVIFLTGLIPVLNIFPLGEISAERFLYFPSIGFALILGGLFTGLLLRSSPTARNIIASSGRGVGVAGKPAPVPAGDGRKKTVSTTGGGFILMLLAAILAAYSVRAWTRNLDWRNEQTLFSHTVAAAGGSARAHLNLANVYIRTSRLHEAIPELERALEIDPGYVDALSNLSGVYQRLGRIDESSALLRKALTLAPNNAELHNNLGIIYIRQGQLDEAEKEFLKTIRLDDKHMKAWLNLGLVYVQKGDADAALRCFELVKEVGKEFEMAYYYIGILAASEQRHAYAKQHLEFFLSTHHKNDHYRARAEETLEKLRQLPPPQ